MATSQNNFSLLVPFCTLLFATTLTAQNECQNIGFEYGNLDGFEIFIGRTPDITNNLPLDPGTEDDQHVLQRRTDGNDFLAEMYCIQNRELPVVGQGLGEYSMRLGNHEGGKRVAQIVRELTVTPENNFLILSYAVLLEDPSHTMIDQPRFVFKIKDVDDNLLSCGTYDVFSGPNIEGFENCQDWRVRPWTSAGFELQSFLGQTVRLEITAIDCDRGGHGGYAYVDLTCRPLEIVLSNYCEGESVAFLTVTEGFERYQWNTGHTTNQITINDPVPGTEYTVQVTSATGCTISLTDTLPAFEELPLASLEQTDDIRLCESSNFLYYPEGEHISRLELIGSGYISDSILINTLSDRTYTFVATDDFGCNSDTMSFTVFVDQPPFVTSMDVEDITCARSTGKATIYTATDIGNQYTMDGITFQDSNVFEGLEVGSYFGNIVNSTGCVAEFSFEIDTLYSEPVARVVDNVQPHCDMDNGIVEIYGTDGLGPYLYSTDNDTFTSLRIYEDLPEGTHQFYIKDALECIDSISVTLVATPSVTATTIDQMDQHCGQANGELSIAAENGVPPYSFTLATTTNGTGQFQDLAAGEHLVIIADNDGCLDTVTTTINSIPQLEVELLEVVDDKCSQEIGSFSYNVMGGVGPYTYVLDNVLVPHANQQTNLTYGAHELLVTDSLGCTSQMVVLVENTPKPTLFVDEVKPHCNEPNGELRATYSSGTEPMMYALNGSTTQSDNLFDNLAPGTYQLMIEDVHGCTDILDINLTAIPPPSISDIATPEINDCNDYESQIIMDGTRGTAPYQIMYDQTIENFNQEVTITLPPGQHDITLIDANGCIVETYFELEDVEYFYIPNAIMTEDAYGQNDKFIISKHNRATARLESLVIYDRWGNPVHQVENQPMDENAIYWDGRSNGVDCPPGNYAYRIELADACGALDVRRGSITLIR
jgi:gliding motility-associated-like protein